MELDHRHYSSALEGMTREDVENMLWYKQDKIESDKKISELQNLIKDLNTKVGYFLIKRMSYYPIFVSKMSQGLTKWV
jgi:uncharacterized protein YutD